MKRIIPFSKFFIPAAIFSLVLAGFGAVGFFLMGINLGVDFQAGLIQEIQFAPAALRITYNGPGNAAISLSRNSLDVVVSGAGADEFTHTFPFTNYASLGDLARGLRMVEGINASEAASSNARSSWLIQSAQSSPLLEAARPFVIHYLPPGANPVRIEDVRASLLPLGTVSVQVLGVPEDRRFMIRMDRTNYRRIGELFWPGRNSGTPFRLCGFPFFKEPYRSGGHTFVFYPVVGSCIYDFQV
jgi:preprotein translocase subunit SecF